VKNGIVEKVYVRFDDDFILAGLEKLEKQKTDHFALESNSILIERIR